MYLLFFININRKIYRESFMDENRYKKYARFLTPRALCSTGKWTFKR